MRKQPEISTIGDELRKMADKNLAQREADAKIQETAQKHRAFVKKNWPKGLVAATAAAVLALGIKSCLGDESAPSDQSGSTSVSATVHTSPSSLPTTTPEILLPTTAMQPFVPEVDRSATVSIHNAWGIERYEYTCDQLVGSVGLACTPETQTWFNESTDEIKDFTARREYDVIAAMPLGHEPTGRAAVAIVACGELMNGATEQQAGAVLTELWDIPEFNADRLAYLSLTNFGPNLKKKTRPRNCGRFLILN